MIYNKEILYVNDLEPRLNIVGVDIDYIIDLNVREILGKPATLNLTFKNKKINDENIHINKIFWFHQYKYYIKEFTYNNEGVYQIKAELETKMLDRLYFNRTENYSSTDPNWVSPNIYKGSIREFTDFMKKNFNEKGLSFTVRSRKRINYHYNFKTLREILIDLESKYDVIVVVKNPPETSNELKIGIFDSDFRYHKDMLGFILGESIKTPKLYYNLSKIISWEIKEDGYDYYTQVSGVSERKGRTSVTSKSDADINKYGLIRKFHFDKSDSSLDEIFEDIKEEIKEVDLYRKVEIKLDKIPDDLMLSMYVNLQDFGIKTNSNKEEEEFIVTEMYKDYINRGNDTLVLENHSLLI